MHKCFICGGNTDYKKVTIKQQDNKEYYVCENCAKYLDIIEPHIASDGNIEFQIKVPLQSWDAKVKGLYNDFLAALRKKKEKEIEKIKGARG